MVFKQLKLPYDLKALAPFVSEEQMDYHYNKHHAAYFKKLNGLIEGKPEEQKDLDAIVKESTGGVFNNAAQAWNHTFFWDCMSPDGGGKPKGELLEAIDTDHTKKLERVIESIDKNHSEKLVHIVEKCKIEVNDDADTFKESIVNNLSKNLVILLQSDWLYSTAFVHSFSTNNFEQGADSGPAKKIKKAKRFSNSTFFFARLSRRMILKYVQAIKCVITNAFP